MRTGPRLWEIDMLRGIAILMMILFHIIFDLSFFRVIPVEAASGLWKYFAYATASLFLLIVGVSLTLSHARAVLSLSGVPLVLKFVVRGAGIFALGLLVTFVTWLYLGEGFVVFGILHLIGISVMISPLFFRFRKSNAIIGFGCIATGFLLQGISGPVWMLPLGVNLETFWSVDYTPLFPWFGMVLIGMGTGEWLYPCGRRQFRLQEPPAFFVDPLSFLGRHSLLIYLVHQPLIILLIAAVTGMPPFPSIT
jgi:uncharacterized membrane protein